MNGHLSKIDNFVKTALVGYTSTLEQALYHMGNEAALVIDDDERLCGLLTDGDIRRAFLSGAKLQTPVSEIMTKNPLTIKSGLNRREIKSIMVSHRIRHLPVVDNDGRPVGIELLKNQYSPREINNAVVMAGGKGTRLSPLTHSKPKPLLKIGDEIILDQVLLGLKKNGISDVVISVNYLGEQIKNHIEDGDAFDINIRYLEEKKQLGTAGALALLQPAPEHSILVMNADLITELDFRSFCHYHQKSGNDITVCVRRLSMAIPYGVISLSEDCKNIQKLEEKPEHEYLINAGIYILEPSVLAYIPDGCHFEMTTLIERAIQNGMSVGAFPILEYWRDIGRHREMELAAKEWESRRDQRNSKDNRRHSACGRRLKFA